MTLAALLAYLGVSLWVPSLGDVPVRFMELGEIGGLACAAEFRTVPGNQQALCGGFEGIAIDLSVPRYGPQFLLNILYHESLHLQYGAQGPTDDVFQEMRIRREACDAYPLPQCKEWLKP